MKEKFTQKTQKTSPTNFSPMSTSILDSPNFSNFRSKDVNEEYNILETIGKGTFGVVVKAEKRKPGKDSNDYYALKKILIENEKEGFPLTALREISILNSTKHENLSNLCEVVTSKPKESNQNRGSVYLVFNYYEYDLYAILNSTQEKLNLSQIKNILRQILLGLNYLHGKSIIHRDLKSSNILVSKKGNVVITDFGLSKKYSNRITKQHTNKVITLWYRPPELLLGASTYDLSVDIWSTGCIFGEMLIGGNIFKGENEADMMNLISNQLGTLNESKFPGCSNLPLYSKFKVKGSNENILKKRIFSMYGSETLNDLLFRMIEYNPRKRITAEKALRHDFFKEEPQVCRNDELPKLNKDCHEYELRLKNNGSQREMNVGKEYNKVVDKEEFLKNKRKNNGEFYE